MAINRIAGQTLQSELLRDGENLAIQDIANSTPVLYVDIANSRIGINNDNPTKDLDVSGNILADNLSATANVSGGNVIATANVSGGNVIATANVSGGNVIAAANVSGGNVIAAANVSGGNVNTVGGSITGVITGNGTAYLGTVLSPLAGINVNDYISTNTLTATGNITTTSNVIVGNILIPTTGNIDVGNVNIANLATPVANTDAATKLYVDSASGNITANVVGNLIQMGTNSQGAYVSNAVTLTSSTYVSDGIALLNQVLGKLVPPAPTNFPGSPGTLAIASVSSYRMANITQTDNTPGANKNVAAGTTVSTVRRAATYTTNTFTNLGPGDAGTITAVRNGSNVGSVTLNTGASPSGNGTYGGNLVITNNYDYNTANANIAAGFWYVFTSTISGTAAPAGWNEIYIADSATSNTSTATWYYDNSSPSTPSFSSTTMSSSSTTLLYSSTIPHYTNATQFTIGTTVANVSGNMYPTSNTLASGTAGGAFAAPASVNYNASNIGSNTLNAFQTASFTTTANVTTGFGASSTGPQLSVNNSYSTGTLTLTTALANTVLWKSGTATAIDEGNIVITSLGTGSGNAYRIINPGTGNTPAYTGSEAAFNSQSSTLQTYDATVVGSSTQGVLKHDQTNYSTGYLPAGPDLSSGRSGTQYFTFKFVRTDVSKFDITYAGNVAGMWVALPGSVIDSSSSANGWINMASAYAGAGYPGVNAPGNGSDGCALGGVVSLNTTVASTSKTCTFGTVSSSSTATNEIYVRIALTSGQSVTGLSLKAASN